MNIYIYISVSMCAGSVCICVYKCIYKFLSYYNYA